MQCLSCGADIGSSLGLCPKCREKREKRRKVERIRGRRPVSTLRRKTVIIAAPAFIAALAVLLFQFVHFPPRYTVEKSEDSVIVTVGEERWRLVLGSLGRVAKDLVVYEQGPRELYAQIGMHRVETVTGDEYMKFQQVYMDTGRDPAIFLYKRKKTFLLLAPDEAALDAMKSRQLRLGDSIAISGVEAAFDQRNPSRIPEGNIDLNGTLVLLDHLSIKGEQVF